MKLSSLLALLIPTLLLANPITPTSEIKDVIVYLEGAQITSEVKVNLQAGSNKVLIKNLSPNLDRNSIQVNGLGNVSIAAINYNINNIEKKEESQKINELQNQLDQFNRQVAVIKNNIKGLEEEETLLQANHKLNTENQNVTIERLATYAKFYRERIAALRTEIFDYNKQLNDLNIKVNDLNQELRRLRSSHTERRGEITLNLDASSASNLTLELKYNVSNAYWKPTYEIRATNTQNPISIHYKASIFQNTGENWNNVNITLSTGNPRLNTQKPTPNPFYLNFIDNTTNNLRSKAIEQLYDIDYEAEIYERQNTQLMAMASAPAVTREDNITNVLFRISRNYTIVSSPSENTTLEINTFNVPTEYEYFAAPLLVQNVFLTAKLKDWERFDLLPGEANVYFAGSYAGKSYINPQQTEEELVLSLGIDPTLVVERKQINNLSDRTLFGNNRIIKRDYEITLRNNKNIPVEITLLDRVPISQNRDIRVDNISFGNATKNEDTGVVTWKVNLAPNRIEKRNLTYEVRYPRDRAINLN